MHGMHTHKVYILCLFHIWVKVHLNKVLVHLNDFSFSIYLLCVCVFFLHTTEKKVVNHKKREKNGKNAHRKNLLQFGREQTNVTITLLISCIVTHSWFLVFCIHYVFFSRYPSTKGFHIKLPKWHHSQMP